VKLTKSLSVRTKITRIPTPNERRMELRRRSQTLTKKRPRMGRKSQRRERSAAKKKGRKATTKESQRTGQKSHRKKIRRHPNGIITMVIEAADPETEDDMGRRVRIAREDIQVVLLAGEEKEENEDTEDIVQNTTAGTEVTLEPTRTKRTADWPGQDQGDAQRKGVETMQSLLKSLQ